MLAKMPIFTEAIIFIGVPVRGIPPGIITILPVDYSGLLSSNLSLKICALRPNTT
jgi:hypothetical protein